MCETLSSVAGPQLRRSRIRFAALGRTKILYDSVRMAVNRGHQLVLVGTAPPAPEYAAGVSDFNDLAREFDAQYFCDPSINQPTYVRMARESQAGVAISVNWPTLIGSDMLSAFENGVINAHAGDLPRFRGNATPNWAILAGENRIVLSLHKMVESLDAGPILAQQSFSLGPSTTVGEVYDFLSIAVPELFADVLDRLELGFLVSRDQPDDPELSLRCFPRRADDGEIDWNQPGLDLNRLVRASSEPFGGAYSFIGTEKVVIWRAHHETLGYSHLGVPGQIIDIRRSSGEVAVLTGDGVLVLEEIETASGRGPASHRLCSTRERLGMNVTAEIMHLLERVRLLELKVASPPDKTFDA